MSGAPPGAATETSNDIANRQLKMGLKVMMMRSCGGSEVSNYSRS